jgi:hypothetical protein
MNQALDSACHRISNHDLIPCIIGEGKLRFCIRECGRQVPASECSPRLPTISAAEESVCLSKKTKRLHTLILPRFMTLRIPVFKLVSLALIHRAVGRVVFNSKSVPNAGFRSRPKLALQLSESKHNVSRLRLKTRGAI